MIYGITPQLLQIGNVKVGRLGEKRTSSKGTEYRLPQSIDHFLITHPIKGNDDNFIVDQSLMDSLKKTKNGRPAMLNKDGNIIGLPIRVLHNIDCAEDIDLICYTRYAAYNNGKTCECEGNGKDATRKNHDGTLSQVQCPCNWLQPDGKGNRRCKPNGCLNFIIDGAGQVGGCHKFRTTSYRSISSILGSLLFLEKMTQGKLAFLPLYLYLIPQTYTIPSGGTTTKPVVSIMYIGQPDELRKLAFENAQRLEIHEQRMGQIKQITLEQVKKLSFDSDSDDSADFADEFYPQIPETTTGLETHDPASEPSNSEPAKVKVENWTEPEPIKKVGGFKIGDTLDFEFDNGVGYKSVEIISFPTAETVEMLITEDAIFSGKNWKGKKTVKPVSKLIISGRTADKTEDDEYPDNSFIRKQAADALGLPEYPEEPEEAAALKKKMEELSTAAGSSSAPA